MMGRAVVTNDLCITKQWTFVILLRSNCRFYEIMKLNFNMLPIHIIYLYHSVSVNGRKVQLIFNYAAYKNIFNTVL